MSVQEMAELVLDLTATDQAELQAFAEAESALQRTLELEPDMALAHKALGVLLAQVLHRPAEGLPHLRRALELDPDISDAARMRQLLEREKQPR